jgi:hypothetical protein
MLECYTAQERLSPRRNLHKRSMQSHPLAYRESMYVDPGQAGMAAPGLLRKDADAPCIGAANRAKRAANSSHPSRWLTGAPQPPHS